MSHKRLSFNFDAENTIEKVERAFNREQFSDFSWSTIHVTIATTAANASVFTEYFFPSNQKANTANTYIAARPFWVSPPLGAVQIKLFELTMDNDPPVDETT